MNTSIKLLSVVIVILSLMLSTSTISLAIQPDTAMERTLSNQESISLAGFGGPPKGRLSVKTTNSDGSVAPYVTTIIKYFGLFETGRKHTDSNGQAYYQDLLVGNYSINILPNGNRSYNTQWTNIQKNRTAQIIVAMY